MNSLNKQRAESIAEQFLALKADDVTPVTDFSVNPEYTLIAHLPDDVRNSIYEIASELKARFPEHYYYSPAQYHLTVVPIPHHMDIPKIVESLTPMIQGWHLPIDVNGVVANHLQAGAVLYPQEETLVPQRIKLRTALGIPEQNYTAHNPVWEQLLWSNFMRFTTKPKEELLASLRAHIDQNLGSFVLSRYELYEVSTKTLDPASSKLLHVFDA
jgi:hypothetical protein